MPEPAALESGRSVVFGGGEKTLCIAPWCRHMTELLLTEICWIEDAATAGLTQMLHGAGIFTYICAIFGVNVGKYSSTMEHLGKDNVACLCQWTGWRKGAAAAAELQMREAAHLLRVRGPPEGRPPPLTGKPHIFHGKTYKMGPSRLCLLVYKPWNNSQ